MKKKKLKYFSIFIFFFLFFLLFHGGNHLLSYCVIYHYEGKNSKQICYSHADIGKTIDSFEDFNENGYSYNGTKEIPSKLMNNGKIVHVYYIQIRDS